jgi:hypothetical protein
MAVQKTQACNAPISRAFPSSPRATRGKTPSTISKIRTSALNHTIQQTPHLDQLFYPAIELRLLPPRQLLPAAGWGDIRAEAMQKAPHLRQMKSTRLCQPQYG